MKNIFISSLAVLLIGCSGETLQPADPAAFTYATRTLPPQPVYNRITSVRPPEPLPKRWKIDSRETVSEGESDQKVQKYAFVADSVPLEEAVSRIAKQAGYSFYCQDSIARNIISIDVSGSLDDVLRGVEVKSGTQITVDHSARHIRALRR
jgi:hypothetical protein